MTRALTRSAAVLVLTLVAVTHGATRSSAAAEKSPLHVQATLGFDGAYRLRAWSTLTLQVQNDGPPFRGRMVFRDAPDDVAAVEFTRTIELPSHSRKTLTLLVRPTDPAATRSVELRSEGSRDVVSIPLMVRSVAPADRLVVLIGPGGAGVRAQARYWAPEDVQADLVVARARPADLPISSEGYASVDQIVWLTPGEAPIEPDALTALLAWVDRGGHLVVVAGEDWTLLRAPALETRLPLALASREPLQSEALGKLDACRAGVAAPAPEPATFAVRGALRDDARVLMGRADWPLVTRRPSGAGQVDLIGFTGARGTAEPGSLEDEAWACVLEPPGVALASDGDDAARLPFLDLATRVSPGRERTQLGYRLDSWRRVGLESDLSRLETLEPIPVRWLVALMILYVACIGPLDYLVLKRLGRLEWTWFTFPAIVAIFTLGVWGLSLLHRSERLVESALEVVDLVPGSEHARLYGRYGLVSPRHTELAISAPSPGLRVAAAGEMRARAFFNTYGFVGDGDGAPVSHRVVEDDELRVELPIHKWMISFVEMQGAFEAPGAATARLLESTDGVRIEIDGDLEWRRRAALLVTRAGVWSIPDLGAAIADHTLLRNEDARAPWDSVVVSEDGEYGYRRGGQAVVVDSPGWALSAAIRLSYTTVIDRAAKELATERGYRTPARVTPFDLGPRPELPMLFVDGGVIPDGVRVRGFSPQIRGRRVYRLPLTQVPAAGAPAGHEVTAS